MHTPAIARLDREGLLVRYAFGTSPAQRMSVRSPPFEQLWDTMDPEKRTILRER